MRRDATPAARGHRVNVPLLIVLQCLPLLGLGGCTALWSAVPVSTFMSQSSGPAFWTFAGAALAGALASVCWGLGYLYLGRHERLGCAALLLGPLLVITLFGYVFEGFGTARDDADELQRRQAMLWTAAISALPVLLMAWDAWRLARAHDDDA